MEWKVIFMVQIYLFGSVFVRTALACLLCCVAEEFCFGKGQSTVNSSGASRWTSARMVRNGKHCILYLDDFH